MSTATPALRAMAGWCVLTLVGACSSAPTSPSALASNAQSLNLSSPDGLDQQAVIEALFFGTGPLAMLDSPGCDTSLQRMRGWARGSHVRVDAYTSLDDQRREAVQATMQQVGEAFGSILTTSYQTTDDVREPAGSPEGEVAVFGAEADRVPGLCGTTATNCQVVRYRGGAYIGSRVIISTPFSSISNGVVAHELGHAFGLCHLDPARGGFDASVSIMGSASAQHWTALDIGAIRIVYGRGLSPEDPRSKFVAAGLIR